MTATINAKIIEYKERDAHARDDRILCSSEIKTEVNILLKDISNEKAFLRNQTQSQPQISKEDFDGFESIDSELFNNIGAFNISNNDNSNKSEAEAATQYKIEQVNQLTIKGNIKEANQRNPVNDYMLKILAQLHRIAEENKQIKIDINAIYNLVLQNSSEIKLKQELMDENILATPISEQSKAFTLRTLTKTQSPLFVTSENKKRTLRKRPLDCSNNNLLEKSSNKINTKYKTPKIT